LGHGGVKLKNLLTMVIKITKVIYNLVNKFTKIL